MAEPRDAAIHFEAVKLRMNQTKDGVVLHLAIHPDEVPDSLFRSFVGKRYMVAMVEVGDDGEPVAPKERTEGQRAVQSAAMLCRLPEFQKFMVDQGFALEANEEDAAAGLREVLMVDSRKELETNADARKRLAVVKARFEQDSRA